MWRSRLKLHEEDCLSLFCWPESCFGCDVFHVLNAIDVCSTIPDWYARPNGMAKWWKATIKQTNRQTDRQTNKPRLHHLFLDTLLNMKLKMLYCTKSPRIRFEAKNQQAWPSPHPIWVLTAVGGAPARCPSKSLRCCRYWDGTSAARNEIKSWDVPGNLPGIRIGRPKVVGRCGRIFFQGLPLEVEAFLSFEINPTTNSSFF